MHLPRTKPTRRALLDHTIAGMTAVDIAEHNYRTTTDPGTKETWITTALHHPHHHARANTVPDLCTFISNRRGHWTYHRTHHHAPLTIIIGVKPVTDLDLALMTAQIGRLLGMPAGSRTTAGKVHDRATVMLMTSALTVHDPDRGHQFHQFCDAMGLTMNTPTEPWPWTGAE